MKVAQLLNEAEQRVKKLQRDWKRNIAKSRHCPHMLYVSLFFVISVKNTVYTEVLWPASCIENSKNYKM